jgi:outer membrane receptor protein involved in Fe transport
MIARVVRTSLARTASLAVALFATTVAAAAQTTTGTLRGTITSGGAPIGDAQVSVRNPSTGVQRGTLSNADGSYTLAGLIPAAYDMTVRRIGSQPQTRRVVVQIGATHIQNFDLVQEATQLTAVVVEAVALPETRTSEVATNITEKQLETLPTPSRNFLDLAGLAPGVTVSEDRVEGRTKTFTAGGQSAQSVNLFVDGTSFKNDLTGGGIAGQDASRGNPFPRNAIQEYRVISQNFKAEYQKASSAIITATTKSGGNTWAGNALIGYQHRGLVQLDSFQRADQNTNPATFRRPEYQRILGAFSLGGPIIRDKMHFFGSYEGNYQDRANRVNMGTPPSGFTALDTVNITQYSGQFESPFRETLLFGKISYALNDASTAEFTVSNRHETDVRDFGDRVAYNGAVDFRQDVFVAQARHNYFTGPWLNEAKVDFSRFRRNPEPAFGTVEPRRLYRYSGNDYEIGSFRSNQDFIQNRIGLRDDLTYTGFEWSGEHVFKVGASVDFVRYDVNKDNDAIPLFRYDVIAHGDTFNYATPYEVTYGTGNPILKTNNTQFGFYAQDDWSPTSRLTLNIGVRWDYESKMMNYDYVTPQMVIDTLTRYNSQLPAPLDLSRYISTGNERKPSYSAIQPRLGFSYAFDNAGRTTIFGGWGIYYDRMLFDVAVDETLKLTHPTFTVRFAPRGATPSAGEVAWNDAYLTTDRAVLDALVGTFGRPEAWLIDRDIKTPKAQQLSVGIRQLIRDFAVSATYANVKGEDQLTLNWANFGLNAQGLCCTSFDLAPHGFSNFIYSTNEAKTWYNALQLQVDRPYRPPEQERGIGWGVGLAYSYATRELQGVDALGDLFAFPNTQGIPKHPANDEKHRLVGNWIMDMPYLLGIQFSGLATFGGKIRKDVGCTGRFCGDDPLNPYQRGGFTAPGVFPYQTVDVRFRKDFPAFGRTRLGATLDIFNLFNHDNLGNYDTGAPVIIEGGVERPNPNYGKPTQVIGDARRYQVGMEIDF